LNGIMSSNVVGGSASTFSLNEEIEASYYIGN